MTTAVQSRQTRKVAVAKVTAVSKDPDTKVEYTDKDEQIDVPELSGTFNRPVHEVEIGVGLTRSLGNYEFIRVDIRLTAPCAEEDLDSTADRVSDWVAARLESEVESYLGDGEDA